MVKSPSTSSSPNINTQLVRSLAAGQTIITSPTVEDKDIKASLPSENNRSTSSVGSSVNAGKSKHSKQIDSETLAFDLVKIFLVPNCIFSFYTVFFVQPPLKRRKLERRLQCRSRLLNANARRCTECPLYGENLRQLMSVCENKIDSDGLVQPWQERLLIMKPILDRFVNFMVSFLVSILHM